MPFLRIQARLPRDGGAPEDDAVNVWHFDGEQTIEQDADDTVDRLLVFYQTIQSVFGSILTGEIHFKVYDMEDAKPRVPVYEDSGTFVPDGAQLPAELAICLSMQATPTSGQSQRRRRGRVFLGPLSSGVQITEAGSPDVRVASGTRTLIANAAAALASGPDMGDARLAVYSPTTDLTGTTADAFNDVTSGWVDDAFDVQRRRGAAPSVRTAWVPS